MAVSRRQKENDTFSDIAHTLPIEESAKELDKASVLRIAIHYLKLRDVLADCEDTSTDCGDDPSDETASLHSIVPNFSKDVLQALDGFMFMVSKDGKILYATESISNYLGLRQDMIHPQDYTELSAIFQSQGKDVGPEMEALGRNPSRRNFVVRMRCAFTPSVRSITRCSNFKPIYCSAFLKFSNKKIKDGEFLGMVALCKLASVMKIKELCVGAYFKTKHALDLSYTGVDTRIRWILGFDPAEMVGQKAYEYFHPLDLLATSSCHSQLLTKGQSHSCCYRFMARNGEFVWVKSKSCVTYDPVHHLPNGLSIYTWIVRYDEEDDRMKAIVSGDDPGMLGIKDMSAISAEVLELCDTTTTANKAKDASSSSVPVPSMPPAKQPVIQQSPVVHPEVAKGPPPNVNPFQSMSPPQADIGLQPITSSENSPSYSSCDGSPHNNYSNSTFMGASSPPRNYLFNDGMRQSSLESTSPPQSAGYSVTAYSHSNSPPNGSPTHAFSPNASPYSHPGNHSPYSEPTLTPTSYNVPSMASQVPAYLEASMYLPMDVGAMANSTPYVPYSAAPGIKQEYAMMDYGCGDPAYYGSPAVPSNYPPPPDTVKTSSHISQIKARYTKVAVAGSHTKHHHLPLHENSTVQDITHWLQGSVH